MLNNSSVPLIFSIFLSAFLGSWHCAIMCGPICISLSTKGSLWPYHLGRFLSYTMMGAAAGVLGQRLLLHENKTIKWIGLSFLVVAFCWLSFDLFRQKTPELAKSVWKMVFKIQNPSRFLLGFLSVFLPCGWLFYFLVAATATQSPWSGALVMFLLWTSSLPALAGASWLMRDRLRKAQPSQQRIATTIITLSGLYALFAHYL
ncbi:sulfite exporter TauE/SafE family protein [bacterium]|nr:sulfite exporter TauE/SafE family protein [bacterium]